MTTFVDPILRLAARHGFAVSPRSESAEAGNGSETGARASVVEQLVAGGGLEAAALARMLASELGLEFVELTRSRIEPAVLALLPREFLLRHRVLPLAVSAEGLRLAVADPLELGVVDDAAQLAGMPVVACVAASDDLRRALSFHLVHEAAGPAEPAVAPSDTTAPKGSDPATAESAGSEADAPVIRLVQAIIREAVRRRASDIHLEPLAGRLRVRYRIDGALIEGETLAKSRQLAVISRVKIMADISIAEKRLPQDGRIQVPCEGRSIDLRVSTLPTAHGESVVMRILDRQELRPGLGELGLRDDDRATLERLLAAPDGLVLVTGPTGSGKTTTLYAALHGLNRADRKIITVEDPVEYQIAGINQVPVNPATGMTFAASLRAMLRQSPNIVMVGEVRDRETAEIAINAALTGHFVLSTLHTNDAPGAIGRLVDIGVKPFLVAASLRAVVAQRLVRRICADCATPWEPSPREWQTLAGVASPAAGTTLRRGAGCPACLGTGFRGRVGIFEILEIDDEIRRLVYERAGLAALRRCARRAGRRNLREDGLSKVLAGLTSIEEVMGVTVGDPDGSA